MKPNDLLNAHVQVKKMHTQLNEVLDISQQLAEATDRGDEVTVHMLLAMRREPINLLQETDTMLRTIQQTLPDEDSRRLADLLNGAEPASPEETPISVQISANRRLLERVVDLDRRINQKLAGEESVYHRK